jgi:hypothetical protein
MEKEQSMSSEDRIDHGDDLDTEVSSAILSLNERLETEVNNATNRAFNLGCFVGLIPTSLLVILTYFVTGYSWVGAIVILILMILGLILFANVTASIARRNTLKRVYHQEVEPEISEIIIANRIDQITFQNTARENLPAGALLRQFLTSTDSEKALEADPEPGDRQS